MKKSKTTKALQPSLFEATEPTSGPSSPPPKDEEPILYYETDMDEDTLEHLRTVMTRIWYDWDKYEPNSYDSDIAKRRADGFRKGAIAVMHWLNANGWEVNDPHDSCRDGCTHSFNQTVELLGGEPGTYGSIFLPYPDDQSKFFHLFPGMQDKITSSAREGFSLNVDPKDHGAEVYKVRNRLHEYAKSLFAKAGIDPYKVDRGAPISDLEAYEALMKRDGDSANRVQNGKSHNGINGR